MQIFPCDDRDPRLRYEKLSQTNQSQSGISGIKISINKNHNGQLKKLMDGPCIISTSVTKGLNKGVAIKRFINVIDESSKPTVRPVATTLSQLKSFTL